MSDKNDPHFLTFSDGVTFDLSGDMRIVRRSDGLYVVGKSMLIPINSYEEGEDIIREEKARRLQVHESLPHC